MADRIQWFLASLLTGTVVGASPALAQADLLTRAEVYKLVNTVQLLPSNQPARPAQLADVLVPLDALRTASQSRAELLFNEGSLARIGSNAIFRFIPGLRSFQLQNGIALLMSPSGRTAVRVETPGGQIVAVEPTATPPSPTSPPGTAPATAPVPTLAMAIQVDRANNQTQVYALTMGPIKVTDLKGNFVLLQGGQTVALRNGLLGPVQVFDLKTFYQTSSLANGLGPGQESLVLRESPAVQQTIQLVRRETLAALDAQTRWLEGLCTLNARGGSSTLATNCITTNGDDPLRQYQDWRQVTTPPPPNPTPPLNNSTQPNPTGGTTTQSTTVTGQPATSRQPTTTPILVNPLQTGKP